MCNEYGYNHPINQLKRAFGQYDLDLRFAEGHASNLEPRERIRISEVAPVIRGAEPGAAQIFNLKWGFPPPRPKAGPVFNFRSEGRTFGGGRCLIPASHFFEFTGSKYPKTRWRFSLPDREPFCIAGLVRGETYTMLTTEPGPDVAPYHSRQVVIVPPADWSRWLGPDPVEGDSLAPLPAGSLQVEQV